MTELERFNRNAKRLGLCDVYTQRWQNCKSKKQLYDLACDSNSLAYMADMMCRGYGLTADFISDEFGQFVNGKCIFQGDGYTSCIYCRPFEEVHITTTAALLIDCHGAIHIDRPICELYIVGSVVELVGDGRAVVYSYNSEVKGNHAIIKENNQYGR